ncbi:MULTISPECIES: tyrosine-type recombinase/integrase [Bacillaceae]|uniref:Site-specific integrase n=1 Tax=Evansella alkalicola TaxID=745819 RepID=A0ABS6JYH5_9BACI|nr:MULTISPECIES: site-specific integrase [Bacillaceae]MBU9723647.1 site-specific integrase [Bacillus alkalicola]
MQVKDPMQLSLFDFTFEEADQQRSIDEHFTEGNLTVFENDFSELSGADMEEKPSVEKEGETISEFDGISSVEGFLNKYISGTGGGNLSAWSGCYLNKNSQELGIKSNMLAHNGDKFKQKELISIMESLFQTSHQKNVIPLGEKGLKQWFIDNLISELESKLIRQFLVKRSKQLNYKSLFLLILRFTEFESLVSKATRKRTSELGREDFLNLELYEEVMTSQFYHQNFALFYKQMNPFTESSLTYTPKGRIELVLPPAVQSFLTYKKQHGTKPDRLDKYRFDLHRYLRWSCNVLNEFSAYPIEKVPFTLFTQEHLKTYKNYLIKGVQSGRFAENGSMKHFKNIKTVFSTLYHMRFLKNDITRGIRNIEGDDYQSRYMPTDAEIEKFFTAIEQYSDTPQLDKLAFGFMLYLGFRSCELAKLRWENINWSLQDVKFTAKGGKVHSLPLPPRVMDLLQEVEKQESGLVFGKKEQPLRALLSLKYRIFTLIADWKEASGPHQLRHIYITSLTKQDVVPKALKRLARHEDLATTSLYIHRTEDEVNEKAQQISFPWEVN